jgi:hypothetical protein
MRSVRGRRSDGHRTSGPACIRGGARAARESATNARRFNGNASSALRVQGGASRGPQRTENAAGTSVALPRACSAQPRFSPCPFRWFSRRRDVRRRTTRPGRSPTQARRPRRPPRGADSVPTSRSTQVTTPKPKRADAHPRARPRQRRETCSKRPRRVSRNASRRAKRTIPLAHAKHTTSSSAGARTAPRARASRLGRAFRRPSRRAKRTSRPQAKTAANARRLRVATLGTHAPGTTIAAPTTPARARAWPEAGRGLARP